MLDPSIPSRFEPYKNLPRIDHFFNIFNRVTKSGNRLNISNRTYFSNYDRDNSVTGNMASFQPRFSVNLIRPYGNINTIFQLQHNQYFLDDSTNQFDNKESFTVPKLSIDGKLFVERETKILNKSFIQSLEPRLFYLLVPNVRQDHIPNFGTAQYETNFQSILRSNRFGGLDRVGDANQLAFTLTNRYLDTLTGSERFKLSIGQVIHFRNRKVSPLNNLKVTDELSEFLFESSLFLNDDVTIRGAFKYDPNEGHLSKSNFSMRYQPDLDSVIEQSNSIETFGGFEYESCCWGAKLVARRFLKDTDGVHDNSIFMQIHFRGLGGFGRGGSESFIQSGIPGYVDPFE